ncbi:MAG: DUF1801 domain-containing protein [Chitinophagales bacterium]
MDAVLDYIYEQEGEQREILLFLHELMGTYPAITNKIRYRVPFYYRKSWICYLNPKKNNTVEFCFLRGNELSNEQGILESKGRKQVYSLTFEEVKAIPVEALKEIIQEAILLDDTVKYASKRTKKSK